LKEISREAASPLKIKAFDNATYHGGSSSESDKTDDGEFETSDTKYHYPLPGLLFSCLAGQKIKNVTAMQHFSREILTHCS